MRPFGGDHYLSRGCYVWKREILDLYRSMKCTDLRGIFAGKCNDYVGTLAVVTWRPQRSHYTTFSSEQIKEIARKRTQMIPDEEWLWSDNADELAKELGLFPFSFPMLSTVSWSARPTIHSLPLQSAGVCPCALKYTSSPSRGTASWLAPPLRKWHKIGKKMA